MILRTFQEDTLGLLGFGTMRLPVTENGAVDEAQVRDMVRYALEHGVNYFDTAYPYHGGESERVIGRALREYTRESYRLATKYPGHQIASHYDPADVFEDQLQKCGVEYFDYYLLHNVYENSIRTYTDSRWGIVDYFVEQKRQERIRHLGFSCHGGLDCLRAFLDRYGDEMEFCQIQLNYLDWTLQNAQAKVAMLNERHIPIWVMEPVRGGRLARLNETDEATLRALRADESPAAWAFRFLQSVPGVTMILSGMSDMAQMQENVRTFAHESPLTAQEMQALLHIAEGMKNGVPCTACRYCCDGCPKQLDIPALLAVYNELRFSPAINVGMRMEALPPEKQPSSCVGCGRCAQICPQRIDIPQAMREFAATLDKLPKWADICRQRDEAQKR